MNHIKRFLLFRVLLLKYISQNIIIRIDLDWDSSGQNCVQCVLIMKVGDASGCANNCVSDPFDGPEELESSFVQNRDQNVLHVGVRIQQPPVEKKKSKVKASLNS